jgi:hypothetical protein
VLILRAEKLFSQESCVMGYRHSKTVNILINVNVSVDRRLFTDVLFVGFIDAFTWGWGSVICSED